MKRRLNCFFCGKNNDVTILFDYDRAYASCWSCEAQGPAFYFERRDNPFDSKSKEEARERAEEAWLAVMRRGSDEANR